MNIIKIELSSTDLRNLNDNLLIEIDGLKNVVAKNRTGHNLSVFTFMRQIISKLVLHDKIRTSETYTCTLNSFKRFRNNNDIELSEMTSELMEEYESYLKGNHLSKNTCSFYMRILRAVYNQAVLKDMADDCKPFRNVYTGNEKTKKRAIPISSIEAIKNAQISDDAIRYARDMFLFSFYTRGMSFVDMANLTYSDLKEDTLVYRRKKTNQTLKIRWKQCMQDIIDRNPSLDGIHLLPIIDGNKPNSRRQYKAKQLKVNEELKKLSMMLCLNCNLTMYVARHSWASIARDMNIPLSVISDSMGHDSEKTTRIYLTSINEGKIDEANDKILDNI